MVATNKCTLTIVHIMYSTILPIYASQDIKLFVSYIRDPHFKMF